VKEVRERKACKNKMIERFFSLSSPFTPYMFRPCFRALSYIPGESGKEVAVPSRPNVQETRAGTVAPTGKVCFASPVFPETPVLEPKALKEKL